MNNRWILIFGFLLMTIGCSDPVDVATVDKVEKKKTVEAVATQPEPTETEPGNDAAAETKVKSDEKQDPPVDEKLNAHAVLKSAIDKAKTDDKALFVYFSADW